MKLTITNNKENKLLQRSELSGEVTFEKATPSNEDLKQALVEELGVSKELILIKGIHTIFSNQKATFNALAYVNNAAKDKNEVMTKHLRKKAEEQSKAQKEQQEAAAAKEKVENEKTVVDDEKTKETESPEQPSEPIAEEAAQ